MALVHARARICALAVFGAAIGTGVAAGQVTELPGRFVDHLDAAADASSVDLPGDVCSAGPIDHSPQALALIARERAARVLAQLSHGPTMRRVAAIMGNGRHTGDRRREDPAERKPVRASFAYESAAAPCQRRNIGTLVENLEARRDFPCLP